jgi:hypothetical protein
VNFVEWIGHRCEVVQRIKYDSGDGAAWILRGDEPTGGIIREGPDVAAGIGFFGWKPAV